MYEHEQREEDMGAWDLKRNTHATKAMMMNVFISSQPSM